jgi:hypothetical protein
MDVQQVTALGIVGIAAGSLGLRLWRQVRAAKDGDACGGCGVCGKPPVRPSGVRTAPAVTPLVPLETGPQRRPRPAARPSEQKR